MPSVISAGTTAGTAVNISGDTTGNLAFQTNGTTTAMTITNAQNVGIGTTTPTVNLTVNGSTNPQIAVTSPAGTGAFVTIAAGGTTINGTSYDLIQDSSGNAYAYNRSNANFIFGTNNTERMRITADGSLRIGTTAGTGTLGVKTVNTSAGTWGCYMTNSADTIMFAFLNNGNFYTGGGAGSPYNNTTASAANCFISSDQGLLQRSTSSIKYKTDVKDATYGLAEVMQLRPVTYKGKNDGDTVFGGLIAEEVDAIGLKEFVQYAEDGSPDALAYGNMVSLLAKAIQELKAELDATKAEVAALKGAQ